MIVIPTFTSFDCKEAIILAITSSTHRIASVRTDAKERWIWIAVIFQCKSERVEQKILVLIWTIRHQILSVKQLFAVKAIA